MLQGREGKVTQVYRKKWVIHIERITREKVNGEHSSTGASGRPVVAPSCSTQGEAATGEGKGGSPASKAMSATKYIITCS